MLTPDNLYLIASYTLICVAANTTLWGIAQKYRLLERYETYKKVKWRKPCIICLSLWAALLYTLPIALETNQLLLLVCPFLAAGLTVRYSFR